MANTDSQPIVVNDREQLIYLLTEAAEIEHGLMCSYLYAGWSLKQSTDEGLHPAQLQAVDAWRDTIQSVAMEEMLHLALVSNLLMSLGAPPHFMRTNFPLPPGYHPSSIVVRLTPLTRDTVDHFVYLERPEGVTLPQAPGFETGLHYERQNWLQRLTPSAEDYDTVGHLYSGIEEGFRHLAQAMDESRLFVGERQAQMDASVLPLDGLVAVRDLDSALAAISTIVEQGEGSRRDGEASHYAKFCRLRDEYDTFLGTDPAFVPHRQVVCDPVMFHPISGQGQVHVSAPTAARVLDIANASYGLMLRLLASGFGMASGSTRARRTEVDGAVMMMSVMKSLAVLLTTLGAREDGAAPTAGMNFHLARATLALPQPAAGAAMLAERAREIGAAIQALPAGLVEPGLAQRVVRVAQNLEQPTRE